MAPMAEADCCSRSRRRFAVACSVLSRCVRAEAAAAAGRVAAAAEAPHARSEAQAASSTMLLMPGADVDAREEAAAGACWCLTTSRRAGRRRWMRTAVARQDDLQVARKASLQRLMQERRDRIRSWLELGIPRGCAC